MSRLLMVAAALLCFNPHVSLQADSRAKHEENSANTASASYIRVIRDENDQPLFLDTAVKRFVPTGPSKGPVIDLISCIHLGDKSYYETLDRLFDEYDVVLFEMVKEPDGSDSRDGRAVSSELLQMAQRVLPALLGMEFQADAIDYTRDNFVHADLSPTQLQEAIRQEHETSMKFFNRVLAEMIERLQQESAGSPQAPSFDAQSFSLLSDPAGVVKLKQIIADKLDRAGIDSLFGETLDRLLIHNRNAAAIKVLKDQLAVGKKKIAILYGAAHMPDLEKRLRVELGYRKHSAAWMRAWDIKRENEDSGLGGLLRALTGGRE